MINPMQNQNANNPIDQIMSIFGRGISPQQLAQNILQNNPQAQQMMNTMQQKCGNRNPRDFILEQCRNNGVNEYKLMQLVQKMGLR